MAKKQDKKSEENSEKESKKAESKKAEPKEEAKLTEAMKSQGYVRPVRRIYKHEKCGKQSALGIRLAEEYAKQPEYNKTAFCCDCGKQYNVAEYKWEDGSAVGS